MSNLLNAIKKDIREAVICGNSTKRDILKVVVGETEMASLRQNKNITDDMLFATIKKVIEGNNTTLSSLLNSSNQLKTPILMLENQILSEYLPKTITIDQIINHLEPLHTQIKEHKNIGQATGLVMKTLKAASLPVDSKDVIEAINKIRGT